MRGPLKFNPPTSPPVDVLALPTRSKTTVVHLDCKELAWFPSREGFENCIQQFMPIESFVLCDKAYQVKRAFRLPHHSLIVCRSENNVHP